MKYFIPYGCNQDPELFYQYINILRDYVAGAYFADINLCNVEFKENENEKNLKRFLYLLKDINVEKFYVINSPKPGIGDINLSVVNRSMDLFGNMITGFTVSNMYLAEYINSKNPNYKIDISSNTLLHNPAQLYYWKQNCNLYSVNVPRMCGRDREKLKLFKEVAEKLDIKVKLILNESCVFGCPFEINCDNLEGQSFCRSHFSTSHFLKSNWISPSELKNIENLVDIGKIVYRGHPAHEIFKVLQHYINGDDNIEYCDLVKQPRDWSDKLKYGRKLTVPISKIPKKIFTCKCSECKSFGLGDCEICEKFLKHYLK